MWSVVFCFGNEFIFIRVDSLFNICLSSWQLKQKQWTNCDISRENYEYRFCFYSLFVFRFLPRAEYKWVDHNPFDFDTIFSLSLFHSLSLSLTNSLFRALSLYALRFRTCRVSERIKNKIAEQCTENVKNCLSEMLSAMPYRMLKGGKDQSAAQMKQRKFGSPLHFSLSLSSSSIVAIRGCFLKRKWKRQKKT